MEASRTRRGDAVHLAADSEFALQHAGAYQAGNRPRNRPVGSGVLSVGWMMWANEKAGGRPQPIAQSGQRLSPALMMVAERWLLCKKKRPHLCIRDKPRIK